MEAGTHLRRRLLLQNGFFVVLLVAAALMLAKLAQDYHLQWDLTQNRRNTLSKSTVDVLRQMKGPVTITAYATEQDPQLGDIRKIIQDFVEPYRRGKGRPDAQVRRSARLPEAGVRGEGAGERRASHRLRRPLGTPH